MNRIDTSLWPVTLGRNIHPDGTIGTDMTSPDPNQELVALLDKQLCALEKQVFGVVTEPEMQEYEARRERIWQLYKAIVQPRAA